MLPSELAVPVTVTVVPVARSVAVPDAVLEIWVVGEYKIIFEPPVVVGNCKVMLLPSLERMVPIVKPAPAAPVLPGLPAKLARAAVVEAFVWLLP